jgi:MYXO-CTERM domain-containing protein
MAKYDPQRTRPNPAPTDGPAPVDELLGVEPGAMDRAAVPATAAPPAAPAEVYEDDLHVHGPDCAHDEVAIGPIVAAVAAAGVAAFAFVRRRRRHRDESHAG